MSEAHFTDSGLYATARRGGIGQYETALAFQLRERGVSIQNIAMQIGRSQEDVRAVLTGTVRQPRPEPEKRSLSPERVALRHCTSFQRPTVRHNHFLDLYQAGEISLTKCASACGKRRDWVRRCIDLREGVIVPQTRADGWTPEMDATLIEMTGLGLAAKEIAVKVGKSKHAVIGRRHRLKGWGRFQ